MTNLGMGYKIVVFVHMLNQEAELLGNRGYLLDHIRASLPKRFFDNIREVVVPPASLALGRR